MGLQGFGTESSAQADESESMEGVDGLEKGRWKEKPILWQIDHRYGKPVKVDENGRRVSGIFSPEPEPTHLSTSQLSKFLDVHRDKLSVRYTGMAKHENDVGCISANCPTPKLKAFYYFEIHVHTIGVNMGQDQKDQISLGFVDKPFKMGRHPGEEMRSYGMTSSGNLLSHASPDDRPKKNDSGKPFKSGDIVGAGINFDQSHIFFTVNGEYLGPKFMDIANLPWTPTIGLHGTNASLAVNFGQEEFRFNLSELAMLNESEQIRNISRHDVKEVDVRRHVLDYLKFYGYYKTLRLMEKDSKAEGWAKFLPDCLDGNATKEVVRYKPYKERLEVQQALRALLARSSSLEAYCEWKKRQNLWKDGDKYWQTLFFMSVAAFLYLVRQQRLGEAIEFVRTEVSSYIQKHPESEIIEDAKNLVLDCLGLLAYDVPEQLDSRRFLVQNSNLRSFLSQQQQENLYDGAVSWLLHNENFVANGSSEQKSFSRQRWQCTLEQVLQQLYAVKSQLRTLNSNMGTQFSIENSLPKDVHTSGHHLIELDRSPAPVWPRNIQGNSTNGNSASPSHQENGFKRESENGNVPMDIADGN